ncbi:unnamed protein product, partial [Timema podura]|nr:unnamed protein product [Timema podura]
MVEAVATSDRTDTQTERAPISGARFGKKKLDHIHQEARLGSLFLRIPTYGRGAASRGAKAPKRISVQGNKCPPKI